MATRFVITDHALDRFIERTEFDSLESDQYRELLLAKLARGIPFGGQMGNDVLYLLPCGLVAVVIWDKGTGFVKTVLTRDHAIASMESRRAILRFARSFRRQVRDPRDSASRAELRGLAERHFHAGIEKKERNVILREHGFDPAGEAGEIYRAAYRALIQSMRGSAA